MMLTRPRARNASTAALQVSLNIPIKTKSAPEPESEPAPTPEPEVDPESPRKLEIDAANAALRSVLVELHERAEASRECSQCLDEVIDRVIADEERRVVEEARSDAERSFIITRLMNEMIERVEGEVADQAAQRAHFASQLAAEMADECVREAAADVARDVFVTVQVPTVVRRDIGAWSHTQPPGTAIVHGYDNVDVCVNAQDVARACGLNVHASAFVPMANSLFSASRYA